MNGREDVSEPRLHERRDLDDARALARQGIVLNWSSQMARVHWLQRRGLLTCENLDGWRIVVGLTTRAMRAILARQE